jgi:uncharacterized repeat protein (TIGR01451 family)
MDGGVMDAGRRQGRSAIAGLIAALCACALAVPASAAAAPTPRVAAAIASDGVAPFDADNAAGHDSSAANGIVRTYDSLLVRLDWSVNRGAGSGVVLRSTLPTGAVWTNVPSGCIAADSSLQDSERTVVCALGDRPEGSSGTIYVPAQVTQARNGDTFAIGATIDAAGAAQASSPTVSVTASAAPRANLRDSFLPPLYQPDIVRFVQDPSTSQVGVLIRWYVTLELPSGGRGSEGFTGDMTFVDRASLLTPNTKLVTWGSDLYGPACSATVRLSAFVPFGKDIGSPLDNPQNTTRDSGTWTCQQTAAGQDIGVTVAGADWTSAHFPVNAGYLLPLTGRKVMLSGYVTTWTPNTDIPSGTANLTNAVTGLGLQGVSGAAVTDSTAADNSITATVTTSVGGTFESWMESRYKELDYNDPFAGPGPHRDIRLRIFGAGAGNRFIATGSESNYAGDSVSLPGDVVTMRMNTYTRTVTAPQPGRVLCAKVDPDAFQVVQTPAIQRDVPDLNPSSPTYFQTVSSSTVTPPDGAVVMHAYDGVTDFTAQSTVEGPIAVLGWQEGVDYDVQYAFKTFAGGTKKFDLGHATCDDTAPDNGQWYDTLAQADAAAALAGRTVDMVRIVLHRDVDPYMNVVSWLSLKVIGAPATNAGVYTGYGFFDPQPFPGNLPAANWVLCHQVGASCNYYDADTHPSGAQDWGDRTRIGDVAFAIEHRRNPQAGNPNIGEVSPLLAPGEQATYQARGSVLGPAGSSASASNVAVTVTVPAGEQYIAGSSQGAGEPTVTNNANGTQTLVYTLGSVPVNTDVQISYRAVVRSGATPFAVETNTAVISGTQAIAQSAATRTATTYTAYSGPHARLQIDEQTTTPTIAAGGEIRYSEMLTNTGPQDLTVPTLVSVLPFNGDDSIGGRASTSQFHGTVSLAEVLAPPGSTVTYTSAPGSQIARDAGGTLPGGYGWCTEAQFGTAGCPASLAEVTAFKVVGSTLAAGGADRVVSVRLNTAGNQCGDRYGHDASGGSSSLLLPVESNDIAVAVPCPEPPIAAPAQAGPAPTGTVKTPARPGRARLSIRKTAARTTVRPGQAIKYRVLVRNIGTATARSVRVCDTPSSGLAVLKVPDGATLRDGAVCWKIDTLRRGASKTLTVTMAVYRSSAGRTVPNTVRLSANGVKGVRATAKVRARTAPARQSGRVTG